MIFENSVLNSNCAERNYGGKMSLFENFVYKNGEIVDNSWVKWHHFGVPDEGVFGNAWSL